MQTFPKSERLSSFKVIGKLFSRSSEETFSFLVYPYRVVVLEDKEAMGGFPEVLISVPKRTFKKAVSRNRIKRLTREAYRTQKQEYPVKLYIGLLFVGKEMPVLKDLSKSLKTVLLKLKSRY